MASGTVIDSRVTDVYNSFARNYYILICTYQSELMIHACCENPSLLPSITLYC